MILIANMCYISRSFVWLFQNENKRVVEDIYALGVPVNQAPSRPKSTEIKPFSFEERDKKNLENRERKRQEV